MNKETAAVINTTAEADLDFCEAAKTLMNRPLSVKVGIVNNPNTFGRQPANHNQRRGAVRLPASAIAISDR